MNVSKYLFYFLLSWSVGSLVFLVFDALREFSFMGSPDKYVISIICLAFVGFAGFGLICGFNLTVYLINKFRGTQK